MKNKTYYLGFIYFSSMLALAVLRLVSELADLGAVSEVFSASRVFTLFAQPLCMGLIPVGLYLLLYKKFGEGSRLGGLKRDLGLNRVRKTNWKDIVLISLLATLVVNMASMLWQLLLSAVGYSEGATGGTTSEGTLTGLLPRVLFVAVLPAIFEELTNRGLVRGAYYKPTKPLKYVLMSALLFALMHQNITQTGYAFVAGLFMATLMHYTNSIIPAVVYHFTNNLVTIVLASTGLGNMLSVAYAFIFSSFFGVVVGLIAFGVVLYFIGRAFIRIRTRERIPVPVRFYDAVIYVNRFSDFSAHTVQIGEPEKPARLSEVFFYAAILLNVLLTGYTLYWGLIL